MFITHAQNFEDVVLRRFFGHYNRGFYIDVGACWPDVSSVTKSFYDAGWRGINIEPHPKPFARLRAARPRDVNLNIALNRDGRPIELYEGLSEGETSRNPRDGGTRFVVETWTLQRVCETYVKDDVDFLKIDVEGMELEIIEGADFHRFRPKVIICEVTQPWSVILSAQAKLIDAHLADENYEKVYFDGLNSFYVDRLGSNVTPASWLPPNVLDNYITAREADLAAKLLELTSESQNSTREIASLELERTAALAEIASLHRVIRDQSQWAHASTARVEDLTNQLSTIEKSRSWRLTRPLRFATWHALLTAKRVRLLPGAVVRRGAATVRVGAPKFYGRIAVSPLARRLNSALQRPADVAESARLQRTGSAARATAETGDGSRSMNGLTSNAVTATPKSFVSGMRGWNFGKRLDA